jgi:hypothetical protein
MRYHVLFALTPALLLVAASTGQAQVSEEAQAKAVAAIEKLGGKVEIDGTLPGKPVVAVDLAQAKIKDDDLACLVACTELRKLQLERATITDAALVHIRGLAKLELLNLKVLSGNRPFGITDKGLVHLKDLKQLKRLFLNGANITDQGLENLKGLTELEWLVLLGAEGFTDRGLEHFKGLTKLQVLDLRKTPMTEAGKAELKKALPKTGIMGPGYGKPKP